MIQDNEREDKAFSFKYCP